MTESMRYAWRQEVNCDPRFTHAELRVAMAVESHTNPDGTNAHPGVQRIATALRTGEHTHVSERTVRRALARAEELGYLERTVKGKSGRGRNSADVYRLRLPDDARQPDSQMSADDDSTTGQPNVHDSAPIRGPSGVHQSPSTTGHFETTTGHFPTTTGHFDPDHQTPGCPPTSSTSLVTPDPFTPELQKTPSPRAAKPSEPTGFDDFWQTYPRRQGKAAAIKAYEKALRRADVEEILAAAHRYATDPNREDQFTAHPTTWLNQDRWLDDALPSRTPARNGPMSASEKVAGWGAIAAQMADSQEPQWAIEAGG